MLACKSDFIEKFRLPKASGSTLMNPEDSRSWMFPWNWASRVRRSRIEALTEQLTCLISPSRLQHSRVLRIRQNITSGILSGCNKHKNVSSTTASGDRCPNFRYLSSQDINWGDADTDTDVTFAVNDDWTKWGVIGCSEPVESFDNVLNEASQSRLRSPMASEWFWVFLPLWKEFKSKTSKSRSTEVTEVLVKAAWTLYILLNDFGTRSEG